MSKKWYSYFVSVDPGSPEAASGENAAPTSAEARSAAQAVADIAASIRPAPPSFSGRVADPASFDQIYQAAEVPVPEPGGSQIPP